MIRELRIRKGLTQEQLGEKVGRSAQLVGKWESGKGVPTTKQLLVLSETLGVSLADLLNTASNTEVRKVGLSHQSTNVHLARPALDLFVEVPFLSAKAQAGPAHIILSDCEPLTGETYPVLSELVDHHHQYLVITLMGSSMEPVLQSGSIVLTQFVEPENIPYESGGVYAIRYADRLVIKRIRTNEIRTQRVLTLHSDNEVFGQIIVPIEELQCIWRVKCLVYQPVS